MHHARWGTYTILLFLYLFYFSFSISSSSSLLPFYLPVTDDIYYSCPLLYFWPTQVSLSPFFELFFVFCFLFVLSHLFLFFILNFTYYRILHILQAPTSKCDCTPKQLEWMQSWIFILELWIKCGISEFQKFSFGYATQKKFMKFG